MFSPHLSGDQVRRLVFLCFLLVGSSVSAQSFRIQGRVVWQNERPVAGAEMYWNNQLTVTDGQGLFWVLLPDNKEVHLKIVYAGSLFLDQSLTLCDQSPCEKEFSLALTPEVEQDLVVVAMRTAAMDASILPDQSIRRIPAPVTGALLRAIPGVDSVRRGPLGLDPVIRGLREDQVGQYFDDERIFPAGPGRMDSSLSHIDPSAVNRIQVVKGPYALTWGAGNLSAIRIQSFGLDHVSREGFHGSVIGGYHSNSESSQAIASVYGRQGRLAYWFHGVDRQGGDYLTGKGESVPGDYQSYELRGKLRIDLNQHTDLTFSSGYQDQQDVDYPGRLLDATFFRTWNHSLSLKARNFHSLVQQLAVMMYTNSVDHAMNNDNKPTALPAPNRKPPFPLQVQVDTESEVLGGKAALQLAGTHWNGSLGLDYFRNRKDALRLISRRDTGMLMFQDKMWPDVTFSDLGLYGQMNRVFSDRVSLDGTLRTDWVSASAGRVSDFFLARVGQPQRATETNLSGALTLDIDLRENWRLSLGLGSVVRSANPTERFSDRIPSTSMQTSAEFMGNPDLQAERANQADLWLEGNFSNFSLHANAFSRVVKDYITIEATDLPTRLPLSPPTVYRYVNGEAGFQGLDLSLRLNPSDSWWLRLGTAWLEGDDTLNREPAFGVTPFTASFLSQWTVTRGWSILNSVTYHGTQDRVAISRNEATTDDYTIVDLDLEAIFGKITLQLGAANLLDRSYSNHLNARNPFTGQQIGEPGRQLHLTARYRF